ncbi:amino acid adenylation domain-containing protein [Paenibacillus pabuli]|uniref:amino acid adenylation domain-containing protein n=1 Tax=Paenibacillus pabuli TaxID=1472 RepID=UPI003CFAB488
MKGEFYSLTQPQRRVWLVDQVYSGSSINNIGGIVLYQTDMKVEILAESIYNLVQSHEAFHLKLTELDGQVVQYTDALHDFKIGFMDFSEESNPLESCKAWMQEESSKAFKLYDEPLYSFSIVKNSNDQIGYFVKLHHIIADGWSIKLLTEGIRDNYVLLTKGHIPESKRRGSYLEFVEKEREYFSSDRFMKDKLFWEKKSCELNMDQLSKGVLSTKAKRKTYMMSEQMVKNISLLSEQHSISVNSLFVSLISLYFLIVKHQEQITVGIPVLNRSGVIMKNTIGMFTSTMPLFIQYKKEQEFINYVRMVQDDLKTCFHHQRYPYNFILDDVNIRRSGYDELFQVCINYSNAKLANNADGIEVSNIEFFQGQQPYSIHFLIKDWYENDSMRLDIEYKEEEYSSEQIDRIYYELELLLNTLIVEPSKPINQISLLSLIEYKQEIFNFNQTDKIYPKEKTFQELFERQVSQLPEHIAVSHKDRKITYFELNNKANSLSYLLKSKGIGKDSIVGIYSEHSIETIIAVLSVIKAGAAFLPIDPTHPLERIDYILRDSGASMILTDRSIDSPCEVIRLDCYENMEGNIINPAIEHQAKNLVYVIYTSGSTGLPKGVMVENTGLINYLSWAKEAYVKSNSDKFALYTSLAFDLTITSLLLPLISGNEIIIYLQEKEKFVLFDILDDRKVTIIKLTPAHLSLIRNGDGSQSTIKRFIVGGENLSSTLASEIDRSFNGNVEIYNEYGPSEAVVGCMTYLFDREDFNDSVPIGQPIHNVQIYLLDNRLQPVRQGEIGEIYISGDGVARGYYNKPDLTADKFLENPFIQGKRMYRTGDMAVRLTCGNIKYIGRADHQVNLNGYRIELGEIEKRLELHKSVSESVVTICEGARSNKILSAFIVAKMDVTPQELQNYLSQFFPNYMIPVYFVFLDQLPLTANGKVNRDGLNLEQYPLYEHNNNLNVSGNLPEELVQVIGEILEVDQVSADDNFYLIGGDSIKAIQLSAKMNKLGYMVKVNDILSSACIGEIQLIKQLAETIIPEGRVTGKVKFTPIIEWFRQCQFNNPHYYNQSVLLKTNTYIREEKLTDAIFALIKHHDSLRMVFDADLEVLMYADTVKNIQTKSVDLSEYSKEDQLSQMKIHSEETKRSLRIKESPLIRSVLFELGNGEQRVLLTVHHLAVDGLSMRILMEDLSLLLASAGNSQAPVLSKTHSYQKWAECLHQYKAEIDLESVKYWNRFLHNFEYSKFPARNNEDENICKIRTLTQTLSVEQTTEMMTTSNQAFGTQAFDLMLTALALSLREVLESPRIVMELEGHGREHVAESLDISRTVGWFTSMFPVELDMSQHDYGSNIKFVKEYLRNIPKRGFDYGILKYITGDFVSEKHDSIRFNYLGVVDNQLLDSIFQWADEDTGRDSCPSNSLNCALDINAIVAKKQLRISITYNELVYSTVKVDQLIQIFKRTLLEVIQYCSNKTDKEFTPSDFETISISQNELDNLFT